MKPTQFERCLSPGNTYSHAKFNGSFQFPDFDTIAAANRDFVISHAESFGARLRPNLTPIRYFVNTKILLFVADNEVLVVERMKVLVVTTWWNLFLPNGLRFPKFLTADVSDVATNPVPFVLRDD